MLTIPELLATRQQFKAIDCPHCGKRLNPNIGLVFATRNCPHCGQRVVAEPVGEGEPPLTCDQLDVACAAYRRTMSRACWIMLAGFLSLFVTLSINTFYLDTIRDAVVGVIDPGLFAAFLMLGPLVVLAIPAFIMLGRANRSALKCPHCSAPCSICSHRLLNLTQLTGNCAGCGRRLVEHPPEEPARVLPTVAEYEAAMSRLRRSGVGGMLLLGLGLAIPVGLMYVIDDAARDRFWRDLDDRYGPLHAAYIGVGIALAGVVVIFGTLALGLYLLHRRQDRVVQSDPALHCPHCRTGLLATNQVIATQRCPACRKRVLAEPVGVAEESPRG